MVHWSDGLRGMELGQPQQSRNSWSWCYLSHQTSQLKPGREEIEIRWIIRSLLNFHSCTMKLGYFLGLSSPLWKYTGAHRQSHFKNTDFIDILEATSGVYASERILNISTLKPMSNLLENHQLLCELVQFSVGKYLGLNFDHAVIFLIPQKKIFQDCIWKYISTSFSEIYFLILSGFQWNRIHGIDLTLPSESLLLVSYTRGCYWKLGNHGVKGKALLLIKKSK